VALAALPRKVVIGTCIFDTYEETLNRAGNHWRMQAQNLLSGQQNHHNQY